MKYLSQKLLLGIWILVMITGTIAVFWGITHESIWYDESYTAAMTNHPLLDILRFSSGDVHPPLYSLMVRLFSLDNVVVLWQYQMIVAELGSFTLSRNGMKVKSLNY